MFLKANSVGTLEALRQIVASLSSRTTDVNVRYIKGSVGNVCKTDIDAATVSGSSTGVSTMILGFNVDHTDHSVRSFAKQHDISVVLDTVIYRLEDALKLSMMDMMPKVKILTLQVIYIYLNYLLLCYTF